MLKIRRPLGRLIFNMGIAIPGKTVFLIETAPWFWNTWKSSQDDVHSQQGKCYIYCWQSILSCENHDCIKWNCWNLLHLNCHLPGTEPLRLLCGSVVHQGPELFSLLDSPILIHGLCQSIKHFYLRVLYYVISPPALDVSDVKCQAISNHSIYCIGPV